MIVLAIESTCDETGAAVMQGISPLGSPSGHPGGVNVLSNVVASSAEIHTKYGGVVPEVAAREQITSILPVVIEALEKADITSDKLDAIAVAVGPGLIGSLIIGVETAKTLALAWDKSLITVNHMMGHVLANWIGRTPELPAVALVVSGGHTDLVHIKSIDNWEWIGGTRDDAAGECFDKTARLLGLGYPGGPAIERAAEMAVTPEESIRPPHGSRLLDSRFKLPRPMIHVDTLEMSFSGLKSSLDTLVRENPELIKDPEIVNLLAKEVSEAVTELLVNKTMKAVDQTGVRSVLLAGGVAASKRLREELQKQCNDRDIILTLPEFKYCTDNAAMIGAAAIMRPEYVEVVKVRPNPGLETV